MYNMWNYPDTAHTTHEEALRTVTHVHRIPETSSFPPNVSELPPHLAPYFHNKYPTQKPIGETDLSFASCLLAWLSFSKAFLLLKKTSVAGQRSHLFCFTSFQPALPVDISNQAALPAPGAHGTP